MKRKLKSALGENCGKKTKLNQSQARNQHSSQSQHTGVYSAQSESSVPYCSQSDGWNPHRSQSEGWNPHRSQSEGWNPHRSQSEGWNPHRSQSEGWNPHRSQSEQWESDSGFSSGRSSPVSGCVSPVVGVAAVQEPVDPGSWSGSWSGSIVSLDCEMVGTGPRGGVSEVARCSLVDYSGRVLFDKYILPIGRVTDYRSQWSGIRKEHLRRATPFVEAREEVKSLLRDKILVGHSVQVDLMSLDLNHPGHMIRDTSCSRLLTRLAGLSRELRPSLKRLTNRLLHRKIQVGKRGHCSVEDARAALDLYKLVEGEWEREVQEGLRDEREPRPPSYASSPHFLNDEYWSPAPL